MGVIIAGQSVSRGVGSGSLSVSSSPLGFASLLVGLLGSVPRHVVIDGEPKRFTTVVGSLWLSRLVGRITCRVLVNLVLDGCAIQRAQIATPSRPNLTKPLPSM